MEPGHGHPGRGWSDELLARQSELLRFARRLAADAHHAEDLLQELNLLALDPRRAPVEAPFAWMKGVLRRLFRGELRSEERRRRHERCAARRIESEPGGGVPRPELERVLQALERLAEPYRTTLVLRFVEGRTPAQVAARAGVPLRTVHTRTTRGLALLRRTLARGASARGEQRAVVSAWRRLGRPAGALSTLAGLAACALFVAPTRQASRAQVRASPPVSEYELLILDQGGQPPADPIHATRDAAIAADPGAEAATSARPPERRAGPPGSDWRG